MLKLINLVFLIDKTHLVDHFLFPIWEKKKKRNLFFFLSVLFVLLFLFDRFDQTYIYKEILSEVPTIATIHIKYILKKTLIMSGFKSYIKPELINDNKDEKNIILSPRRHITQVKNIYKYSLFCFLKYKIFRLQLELMMIIIIMINLQFHQHVIQWLID